MPQHICNGTMIMCNFGMAPSTLTALPHGGEDADEQPQATILDHLPMVNIPPFALCMSPANPDVATAAAMGVLTPQPCFPVTPAPWAPGGYPLHDGNVQRRQVKRTSSKEVQPAQPARLILVQPIILRQLRKTLQLELLSMLFSWTPVVAKPQFFKCQPVLDPIAGGIECRLLPNACRL